MQWIEAQQRWHRNIYYSLAHVASSAYRKKAKKDEVTEIIALHVDIDLAGGRNAEEEAQILERLRNYKWPVSTIIFSGGGFQGLWRLQEPLKAQETRHMERIEALNKQLIEQLGGDPACWNADRILRLPGSINYPDPKKIEKQIMEALPKAQWDAGMAMSFLGREICRPTPKCDECLMTPVCKYYNEVVKAS